jgi:hypothetical protein
VNAVADIAVALVALLHAGFMVLEKTGDWLNEKTK